jgi:oxalate decarboxylase
VIFLMGPQRDSHPRRQPFMSNVRQVSPENSPRTDRSLLDRRKFIGASALVVAGLAMSRVQGQDIEKVAQAQQNKSMTDPGPENSGLSDISPNGFLPPPTDHGEPPEFWNSFAVAHRRVQPGGWTRQVTVDDFPISKDIAGVNMRLTAGGIRELHWHEAAEWALMLSGKARITALDYQGKGYVKDVGENDLWFFPPGIPHSIQGLEPDGCEFLLVFDDGNFSEGNTTLITDWTRHVPPEVLAKNWGVPVSALDGLYTVPSEGLFIFQKGVPGALADDQRAVAGSKGFSQVVFDFPLHTMDPSLQTKSGEVRIVDTRNFPVTTTSMAHVTVKPGGLRELHWHPTANEWSYFLKGKGRMTVFFTGAKARTMDFNAGDVGYVPKTFGHYVENTGDTDLVFIEMFKNPRYQDLSLNEWVTHAPPQLVTDHLRISAETLSAIPSGTSVVIGAKPA